MPTHATVDTSGLVPPAQLGTGTPSSSNFLRGDGSWQAVAGGGATNLSTTVAGTTVTINSDTGTDAIIPSATTTDAGVLSASDKTKLNGVATGATANSSDAFLLARANHTGTQSAGTITGLATVATSGSAADLSGNLAVARLNSGTNASATSYWRGDGSWATPGTRFNQSTSQQGAGFATDTYLTGSYIILPTGGLKVGSRYHCMFNVTKTAAGTAAPVIQLRAGTAGSTADTSRLSFTFPAQTAVIDNGVFELWFTVRTAGVSAVLQGVAQLRHGLSVTGLSTSVSPVVLATSAAFDATVANIGFGLSVNGGASASWTVQLVQAELDNLN